ncbi:hypothetical protein PGN05_23610, partial [Geodermatophilus sp. CPCC 206100]
MAIDRALTPRSSRVADDLTLSGLLDVLDRAEEFVPRRLPRPVRAAVGRSGAVRRPLPAARPVPVPAGRPPSRRP